MSLHLQNPVISKLARIIMKDGKMHCALRILDDCFVHLRSKHGVENPAEFTVRAIDIAKPVVELRKYKVSGRSLQVPTPCRPRRQESLAMRFLRDAFRDRKENGAGIRLANELVELEQKTGRTWKTREELHKRAEQNRSFAHFVR